MRVFVLIFGHKNTFVRVFVPQCSPCFFFLNHPRDYFYQYGEINSIAMVPRQNCCFVTYNTRDAAEKAAEGSFNKAVIRGQMFTYLVVIMDRSVRVC